MNGLTKIIIYLKNISKPVVLTCSENESKDIDLIKENIFKILDGTINSLQLESGDIFCINNKDNISSILITKDKSNA